MFTKAIVVYNNVLGLYIPFSLTDSLRAPFRPVISTWDKCPKHPFMFRNRNTIVLPMPIVFSTVMVLYIFVAEGRSNFPLVGVVCLNCRSLAETHATALNGRLCPPVLKQTLPAQCQFPSMFLSCKFEEWNPQTRMNECKKIYSSMHRNRISAGRKRIRLGLQPKCSSPGV